MLEHDQFDLVVRLMNSALQVCCLEFLRVVGMISSFEKKWISKIIGTLKTHLHHVVPQNGTNCSLNPWEFHANYCRVRIRVAGILNKIN